MAPGSDASSPVPAGRTAMTIMSALHRRSARAIHQALGLAAAADVT
ncbi:hypothetical protein ACPPVO_19540 [Dactylosporangium sp. McL0621]